MNFLRSLKNLTSMVGRWSYIISGLAITIRGSKADRQDAAILVIAPHSTFLDSVIVFVTKMSTIIVRIESMDEYAGSKLIKFYFSVSVLFVRHRLTIKKMSVAMKSLVSLHFHRFFLRLLYVICLLWIV